MKKKKKEKICFWICVFGFVFGLTLDLFDEHLVLQLSMDYCWAQPQVP